MHMEMPFRLYSIFLLSILSCCPVSRFIMAQKNNTLIFTKDNSIRNCSCSSYVRDCDYNLANLMCSCRTVLAQAREQTACRLSYSSDLTVWFTNSSMLGMLLNFTFVHNLKLSLCGANSLPAEYLTLFGLKSLHLYSAAQVDFPEQNLTIHADKSKCKTTFHSDESPSLFYISFLDMSLLNGYSSLKAYSIGNITNVAEYFPHLKYINTFLPVTSNGYVVTLIY